MPRNVVLLQTDQQRLDTIAALGNSRIRTPNLDRLCKMGIGFRHGFTPQPVCGPARHSLFTGIDSRTSGFKEKFHKAAWSPNGRFIPEVLAEGGYRTGGFGKMHFHPLRAHHGFQHFAVHEEQEPNAYREDDDYLVYAKEHGYGHVRYGAGVKGLLYFQPQISAYPEEHHETKWVADRAIDFIDTFHREPFFCYASWMQPHWPVHVPASWAAMYGPDDVDDPIYDEAARIPFVSRMNRTASDLFDPDKPVDWRRVKRSKALYYASVSFIDHQVGRILDCLEAHGILDDTLIVFTADHGETLGDHQAFGKVSAFEPVIGIPFIVAGPGLEGAGQPSDELVTLYDIAPTVYAFTGVQPPPQNPLVGESLLGDRRAVRDRDRVFFEIGTGTGCCDFLGLRTRKWKYAFYHADGFRQLFDVENDPQELDNLCLGEMSPEHERIAAELHASLLAWNAEHGLDSRLAGDDFLVVPEAPMPPDRNSQYEQWVDHLPENEKAELWSDARNVYEVIKDEPTVDPADLDLEYWESRRVPGSIAELERLCGRKLR